jgi:two-component system phosphate regulon sensor histidine kinase PhoR
MKKILPVIITLIGLSLLGLIILQASWLNNLVQLRSAQITAKVKDASFAVAGDFSKAIYGNSPAKVPRNLHSLSLTNDMFNVLKPRTVAEHFSKHEVFEKIRKAFDDEDLKHVKFDFAIINSANDYEMQTENYVTNFFDSASNKNFIIPILPDSGTDLEGLNVADSLVIVVPDFQKQVWGSLIWIILGSGLFTVIIFAAFFITIKTLLNQKKLSEIKSDFINNMTHEFKTPLATISLAIDAIRNPKVQADLTKLEYFSSIIKEENKRMNKHVETILHAALMEKKELQFNIAKVNANVLIAAVVDNFQLQLNEKEAKCILSLDAVQDEIDTDEQHFSNVISNLVDNAIKYSKEDLTLQIRTFNQNGDFVITVEDNGIGMNKETVKNVFEKFYRAHTGNVHNVKGFGLGMSYVKTIVDALNGEIKVDSTLGKGTIFTLEIPLSI